VTEQEPYIPGGRFFRDLPLRIEERDLLEHVVASGIDGYLLCRPQDVLFAHGLCDRRFAVTLEDENTKGAACYLRVTPQGRAALKPR
jgi:hypothetical protein